MPHCDRALFVFAVVFSVQCLAGDRPVAQELNSTDEVHSADGTIVKAALEDNLAGQNLLRPDAWRPWQAGFELEQEEIHSDMC